MSEYIKNPLNYVGSKDRLLPQIIPILESSGCDTLWDVFCGSSTVGVNSNFDKIIASDGCWQLIRLLEFFRNNPTGITLAEIDNGISMFELSKTNKEGFLKLRELYNKEYCTKDNFNPVLFYLLITHSFNYSIHINSSGGFSVPFGKDRSYFSPKLREKLIKWCELARLKDIEYKHLKLEDIMLAILEVKDLSSIVFFLDPPYLVSDSSYSRIHGLKWTQFHENALYGWADSISSKGGKFVLTNFLKNGTMINETLSVWSSKYNVSELQSDYRNCNYQKKGKNSMEIMVRNW